MDVVNERFHSSGNELVGYEEWDEGEDKKWILSFFVDDFPEEKQLN